MPNIEDQTELLLSQCRQSLDLVLSQPHPPAAVAGATPVMQAALTDLSGLADRLLAEIRSGRLTLSAADRRVLLAVAGQTRKLRDGEALAADVHFASGLKELSGILQRGSQAVVASLAAKPSVPNPLPLPVPEPPRSALPAFNESRGSQAASGTSTAISAEFTAELRQNPISAPSLPKTPASAADTYPRQAATIPSAKRLRVLVVDDDHSCSLLLQGLASKYGKCDVVGNGKEAIDAFSSALQSGQHYHLICMDVHMPEVGGQEAVTQIRAREQQKNASENGGVKILMTTASRDVNTILAMYGAKCDGYLIKPFDGKQLDERLKSLGLISANQTS